MADSFLATTISAAPTRFHEAIAKRDHRPYVVWSLVLAVAVGTAAAVLLVYLSCKYGKRLCEKARKIARRWSCHKMESDISLVAGP